MTYTGEKVVFHAPSRFRSHSHYMAQCALIPIYRMWMCVCVSVINTSFTLNRTLGRIRLAREWLNKAQIINFYIFFNEIAIIYWRAFNEKCCICYSLPWHCLKHDSINFQTVVVVVVLGPPYSGLLWPLCVHSHDLILPSVSVYRFFSSSKQLTSRCFLSMPF